MEEKGKGKGVRDGEERHTREMSQQVLDSHL